ncbi:hypothetical protein WA026_005043 [Henosepilachna vigintioctopunctata]|uniref:HTH psq-type domain-containing protein n=1 Tax=Henosepilachna vigintioctopunctata TaxID=420089 RepID=A0AAW1UUC8_9CUCU
MGKQPKQPPKQRTSRNVPLSEKVMAIKRVRSGETKASVARDIGSPESTLRGWCKNQEKLLSAAEKAGELPSQSTSTPSSPSEASTSSSYTQYSPNSGNIDNPDGPLDLSSDVPRVPSAPPRVPSAPPRVPSAPSLVEVERSNREELARLRVQYGLNTPEMFNSGITARTNVPRSTPYRQTNVTNMDVLTAQWQYMLSQHNQIVQGRGSPVASYLNGARTSAGSAVYSGDVRTSPVNPSRARPNGNVSINDSANGWSHSYTPPQVSQISSSAMSTSAVAASLSTPCTSTSSSTSPTTAITPEQLFWNWYATVANQIATACSLMSPTTSAAQSSPSSVPDRQILYQQLTKHRVHQADDLSTAASLPGDRPEARNNRNSRARALLDTLLHNSRNPSNNESTEEAPSHDEAVVCGQYFMRWLESCSDPSITAMHLRQFRNLLNSVIQSAKRKRGNTQQFSKSKRK